MLAWLRAAPAQTPQVDALELLADDDHAVLGVRNHARQELAGVQLDGQLIEVMPRRGIRVSEVNVERQLLLLETRRELERLVATRAARRATSAQRQRLEEIAIEMEAAAAGSDETAFIRLDRELNAVVATAAANVFASGALTPLHALSRRFWYIHNREAADLPAAARAHVRLVRAIARRDEQAAAVASDALLGWIEEFTRATLITSRRSRRASGEV